MDHAVNIKDMPVRLENPWSINRALIDKVLINYYSMLVLFCLGQFAVAHAIVQKQTQAENPGAFTEFIILIRWSKIKKITNWCKYWSLHVINDTNIVCIHAGWNVWCDRKWDGRGECSTAEWICRITEGDFLIPSASLQVQNRDSWYVFV